MTSEGSQRSARATKEDYILEIVRDQGKIKVTDLYGAFSRKYRGAAIRTFLNEYLPALEYRGDISLHSNAHGDFAYLPEALDKEMKEKK